MSAHRWIILAALGVLCTGCVWDLITGPTEVSTQAVATNACGPTDGPGVEILLSARPVTSLDPSPPYVRVAIWHALQGLAGRTSNQGTRGVDDGAGWYHPNDQDFEIATNTDVRIERVEQVASDTIIEGSVDVEFPSAGRFRGDFRAVWIRRVYLCG